MELILRRDIFGEIRLTAIWLVLSSHVKAVLYADLLCVYNGYLQRDGLLCRLHCHKIMLIIVLTAKC